MGDTFNISTSDLKTSDCYVWGLLKKALHFRTNPPSRIGQMREKIEQKKLNMQALINKQAGLND